MSPGFLGFGYKDSRNIFKMLTGIMKKVMHLLPVFFRHAQFFDCPIIGRCRNKDKINSIVFFRRFPNPYR